MAVSSSKKSETLITGYLLLSEINEGGHDTVKIDDIDEIQEYNLSDVAEEMGINDSVGNEDLAKNIIEKCLGPTYKCRKDSEPIIGGTPVSDLKECYISTNPNRGDVMVSYDGSDVLYTEVHSHPSGKYNRTARKTVYLLMECLRMLKAFGVRAPIMYAFVFPRKELQRCVVRLTMKYLPDLVEFQYSIKCLQLGEVSSALKIAARSNKAVCQNLTNQSPELDYILWLTDEEREQWGHNLCNVKSKFGILLMNNAVCLKKPIFSNLFEKLYNFSQLLKREQILYMPTYSIVSRPQFIEYRKIHHDPLTYEEARRCCYELVTKIYEVTQSIHNAGYMHNDLRLPNICFDSNFEPILIDFDFSVSYLPHKVDVDMQKFAGELVSCFKSEDQCEEAKKDEFIQKYKTGIYDESLLEKSIVATGKRSVRSIILARPPHNVS